MELEAPENDNKKLQESDEHEDCKMKTIFKDAVQHRQVDHQVQTPTS